MLDSGAVPAEKAKEERREKGNALGCDKTKNVTISYGKKG